MLTIIKKEANSQDRNNSVLEIRGLSTEKPTENIPNGSIYIEIDTSKIYFYDGENEEWKEF